MRAVRVNNPNDVAREWKMAFGVEGKDLVQTILDADLDLLIKHAGAELTVESARRVRGQLRFDNGEIAPSLCYSLTNVYAQHTVEDDEMREMLAFVGATLRSKKSRTKITPKEIRDLLGLDEEEEEDEKAYIEGARKTGNAYYKDCKTKFECIRKAGRKRLLSYASRFNGSKKTRKKRPPEWLREAVVKAQNERVDLWGIFCKESEPCVRVCDGDGWIRCHEAKCGTSAVNPYKSHKQLNLLKAFQLDHW